MTRFARKPTELTLASIHPSLGARFSPNLHAFLSQPRNSSLLRFGRVYRNPDGVQYLGYVDQELLCGAQLMAILCNGAKVKTTAMIGVVRRIVEVEDFWRDYRATGRCAVDPEHKSHFIGDESRWSVADGVRTCLWCDKASQRLRRWDEVVERSAWVNEPANAA